MSLTLWPSYRVISLALFLPSQHLKSYTWSKRGPATYISIGYAGSKDGKVLSSILGSFGLSDYCSSIKLDSLDSVESTSPSQSNCFSLSYQNSLSPSSHLPLLIFPLALLMIASPCCLLSLQKPKYYRPSGHVKFPKPSISSPMNSPSMIPWSLF